jgi:hypothetical protein
LSLPDIDSIDGLDAGSPLSLRAYLPDLDVL